MGELLVHAGQVVSIDHIAEATWPGRPPVNWANAVHVRVSRLRSLFRSMTGPTGDDGVISTQPGAYRLAPEQVDAGQFEQLLAAGSRDYEKGFLDAAASQLDQALNLWEGEAFTDVAAGECVAAEARRLTELRLVAQERQAEVMLALGAHTDVVTALKPLVEHHPLRETLHGHLMAALHSSGRTAEALAVYAGLRSTLAEELGTEPSPQLRTLHRALLERRPLDTGRTTVWPRVQAVPSAEWAGPSQLPHDTPDLVPSGSMNPLLRALTDDARTTTALTAITGHGGTGKTTAAVHLAHRLRPSFPDGQLFVDLRGSRPDPTDSADALAQMLLALGHPPSALPDGVEARAACFRDRLKGRRVLTVLDDATDEAHVRHLLPGNPESAVIVTSRSWLTSLPFTLRVEHDRMSPHQAVLLFHRTAGADRTGPEPAASQEVARLCDYLPSALRIAGARLAARPHWTVADLVRRLSGHKILDELTHGSQSVRCCFEPAYNWLAEEDRRLFRALGAYEPGLFTGASVAAMLSRSRTDATEALERLAEARLLSVVHGRPGQGRPLFQLRGLAAAYARERAVTETAGTESGAAGAGRPTEGRPDDPYASRHLHVIGGNR
ncbi:putative Regulator protein [Streptomyces afghaniensis 772] [Streptomyces afghaniensis]